MPITKRPRGCDCDYVQTGKHAVWCRELITRRVKLGLAIVDLDALGRLPGHTPPLSVPCEVVHENDKFITLAPIQTRKR